MSHAYSLLPLPPLIEDLLKENGDLKAQYKIQQEDRNYLVKQLVAVKKDNTRLRQEVEGAKHQLKEKEEEIDCLQAKGALGGATKRISNDLVAAIGGAEGVQGRAEHYYHYQQVRKAKHTHMLNRVASVQGERHTDRMASGLYLRLSDIHSLYR